MIYKVALFNVDNTVKEDNPLAHEHIGVVIDNKDPKNLCRVKVVIPGLLSEDNEIWFTRIAPNLPGVTYATPRIGQKIRVWFKDNTLTSGVYGLDYVHKETGMSMFQPGDYGFADLNSNAWRVRGSNTYYQTGSMYLKTNSLTVSGKIFSGVGYTGSITDANGYVVNISGGIITSVSSEAVGGSSSGGSSDGGGSSTGGGSSVSEGIDKDDGDDGDISD